MRHIIWINLLKISDYIINNPDIYIEWIKTRLASLLIGFCFWFVTILVFELFTYIHNDEKLLKPKRYWGITLIITWILCWSYMPIDLVWKFWFW